MLKNAESQSGCDFRLSLVPRSEASVLARLDEHWRDDYRRREMPGIQSADPMRSHKSECLLFNLRLWCSHNCDSALHREVRVKQVQQARFVSPASTSGTSECA